MLVEDDHYLVDIIIWPLHILTDHFLDIFVLLTPGDSNCQGTEVHRSTVQISGCGGEAE